MASWWGFSDPTLCLASLYVWFTGSYAVISSKKEGRRKKKELTIWAAFEINCIREESLLGSNQTERRTKISATQEVVVLSIIFPWRRRSCPDSTQNDLYFQGHQEATDEVRSKGRESIKYQFSDVSVLWKEGYEIGHQSSEAQEDQDPRRHPSHVVWNPSLHQVRNSVLKPPRIFLRGCEMSTEFCHSVSDHCPRKILPPSLTLLLWEASLEAPHFAKSCSKRSSAERLRSRHKW